MNRTTHRPFLGAMADPDVQCMLAFQNGDAQAFRRLVERHTPGLLNYFHLQSRDQDLAEDCVQEVWTRVFRSRHEYRPEAGFSTWLYAVARNHWIDRYRARARRPAEITLSGGDDREDPAQAAVAGEGGTSPDRGGTRTPLERDEMAEQLATAVAKLPEEMREVFVLASVRELPYSEIAAMLGIPVGTVKSRMFHAMRKMRRSLEPWWEGRT